MKLNWLSKRVKTHQTKGLTLIELIIAISITVIIGGIILANYRTGQRNSLLRSEAENLVSLIRNAQNLALSASVNDQCEGVPQYGYGVYIEENRYLLFANCKGTEIYDSGSITDGFPLFSPVRAQVLLGDPIIEEHTLPSGIKIGSEDNILSLTFVFKPPRGIPVEVYKNNQTPAETSGIFNFYFQLGDDDSKRKWIVLNADTGNIEIRPPGCGNGICESGETYKSCPSDCLPPA